MNQYHQYCLNRILTLWTVSFWGLSLTCLSQSDSTIAQSYSFKKAPWYFRSTPFAIYTGAGKLNDKITQNIEIGKSFNVIDFGIALGRNSLRADTTTFLEGKVTMDVGNYGIFANEMTIGAGKVFDSQGSIMLELTYSIFAQIAPRFGIGITTGYYDFANEYFDNSKTFYGIYCRFGLQRTDSGGLLNRGRGPKHLGRIVHKGRRKI